jgi:hypothetical protein
MDKEERLREGEEEKLRRGKIEYSEERGRNGQREREEKRGKAEGDRNFPSYSKQ